MKTKMKKAPGPPNPVQTPIGVEGQGCQIIFGHNVEARAVMMQFSAMADRLIFTPEEAHDVASNLIRFAELARGSKKSS